MSQQKKLIFATQNKNKVEEIQQQLSDNITVDSLLAIGHNRELEETKSTLEGNAWQKARFVYDKYKINCFADDTGLEVEALNNAPGVHSARYAGADKDFKKNTEKVLRLMKGEQQRNARFRTVIALILNGEEYEFEGICNGNITINQQGHKGFGYDPIFKPEGFSSTFAQMNIEEKNKISHRGIAVKQLIEFLNKQAFH